jgi:hypothetical protein
LELLREKRNALFQGVGIIDCLVPERVLACKDRGAAGRTKRSGHERIGQVSASRSHSIHAGRSQKVRAFRVKVHVVVPMVITEDEDDILRLLRKPFRTAQHARYEYEQRGFL